ncbi:MAG TPA: RDD family protein [Terriglobia bacterium]|nr:RDD family protein [Terriglobia bacterium]
MKCPECGTESRPGLSQCIECGHRFAPSGERPGALSHPDVASAKLATASAALADSFELDRPAQHDLAVDRRRPSPIDALSQDVDANSSGPPGPAGPSASPEDADLWRDELSERVEKFRRRRARLRAFDPSSSLDFEFQPATASSVKNSNLESALDSVEGDLEDEVASDPDSFVSQAGWLNKETPRQVPRKNQAAEREWSLDSQEPRSGSASLDFSLGVEPWNAETDSEAGKDLRSAPVGGRFLAGLIDLLVLGLGAGVFVLIFWAAGGRFSPKPLTLAVMGTIALLLVLVYFASFTALTSSTPGLTAMGLDVRALDGSAPTPTAAVLRAFGILVSMCPLMLGFIWALVDSAGLTWHDRMSGTFVAAADRQNPGTS